MAQEQFAGPDYYTEFDPEKFLRDMNLLKDLGGSSEKGSKDTDESQAGDTGERNT